MKPYLPMHDATAATVRTSLDLPRGIVDDEPIARGPADHLGDLALAFRDEFKLDGVIEEMAILSSLQAVATETAAPDRWLALFNSPLGAALRSRGRDLNTAMGFVLSQLPRRPS